MLRRQFGKALIILGILTGNVATPAFSAGPPPAGAIAVVENLHAELLSAMKSAGTTSAAERAARLGPVIRSGFALDRMSRFAAGSGWRKMTDGQKAAYLRAFTEITVATYANRFDGFSGESFATLGTEAALNDSLLVRTELRRPRKN
ncbi:MAG: ABC transporter substrate-binding protein, partial [Rhodospirillales bacterium]